MRSPKRNTVFVLLILFALILFAQAAAAAGGPDPIDSTPIDVVSNPPGKMISVGRHRLHVNCIGSGGVTVLFESGLGGSSLEWGKLQSKLAGRARACSYDRGGYAWSDPAIGRRDVGVLAREANLLLNNLHIRGPIILVGHSFGGFVVRALAHLRAESVVGLILVDASHERQVQEFEKIMSIANMPTSKNIVISPISVPAGLDPEARSKVAIFGRMRKTYFAVREELAAFRQSAGIVSRLPRPVSYPIVVMRRGRDLFAAEGPASERTLLWHRLQTELATLSVAGRVEVATDSGHHIHLDEPDRLIDNVNALVDRYEQTL